MQLKERFILYITTIAAFINLFAVEKAAAQEDANRYTMRSNMIGIGATNRLETYLSPFEYTGTEVRFLHESMRLTKMMNGRISTQQFFFFFLSN